MLDIVERWQETGLLRLVNEDQIADMAYLLENQRIYNERDAIGGNASQFRRLSVPLAVRVFPNLKSHSSYKIESRLNLESCLQVPLDLDWGCEESGLDNEANYTADIAEEVREELDRFIRSQAPFNVFYVQAFGLNENGDFLLYYDLD